VGEGSGGTGRGVKARAWERGGGADADQGRTEAPATVTGTGNDKGEPRRATSVGGFTARKTPTAKKRGRAKPLTHTPHPAGSCRRTLPSTTALQLQLPLLLILPDPLIILVLLLPASWSPSCCPSPRPPRRSCRASGESRYGAVERAVRGPFREPLRERLEGR
jgi:hypothetical protein